jgi:putative nucleotidyltransferase with HDIG domain
MKDPYTVGHQARVSQLATAIAKRMNLPEKKVESIRIASLIHDIGKVSVPSEILNKPGRLTNSEYALVKTHPEIFYKYIRDIDFPVKVADIILQHHERINGSGYPKGLKDDQILLEAKIVGVADVVESMNSKRPYRDALGMDKALDEISRNDGELYDPEVVEVCKKLLRENGFKFEKVGNNHPY